MTMSPTALLITVAGMMAVTYIPRLVPTVFVAAAKLPKPVVRWLRQVPPAVIAALLLPSLLTPMGQLDLRMANFALWVAIPTLLLAWRTKSFYLTILFGIDALAVVRLVAG